MQRRIFYAAGPSDVMMGFLSLAFFGGLVGLCLYAFTCHVGGGQAYMLIKCLPFALAGASSMLYRERVVADPRYRTLDIGRSFFLFPLARVHADFCDVAAVVWKARPQGHRGVQLVLQLGSGQEFMLAKASEPDLALSAEVREYFGLVQSPEHDVIPPPPPTVPVQWGRIFAAVGVIVLVLVVVTALLCRLL